MLSTFPQVELQQIFANVVPAHIDYSMKVSAIVPGAGETHDNDLSCSDKSDNDSIENTLQQTTRL